ncbi:MAG: hypothetical protein ACW98U_17645 [Candidatus Thorarchaeota archaeon]|jgi:predicted membrane protein (TIGR00267 family)
MTADDEKDLLGHEGEEAEGRLHRLADELILTGRYSVARAHIAEEVFDGVLPLLGIILAGYIAAQMQELFIVFETTLLAALGTSIAHFIGGFGGTYLAESAEGKQLIEEMKEGKASKLSRPTIISIEHETTLVLSLIKGLVPAACVLLVVSPMFFALLGWMEYVTSFVASISVGLTLLFILGLFLGRISKGNIWISAAKTLMAGLLTILILFVVSLMTGA